MKEVQEKIITDKQEELSKVSIDLEEYKTKYEKSSKDVETLTAQVAAQKAEEEKLFKKVMTLTEKATRVESLEVECKALQDQIK